VTDDTVLLENNYLFYTKRRFSMKTNFIIILTFFLLLCAGCSEESTQPATQGELKMYIIDSPAAYEQVNIVVKSVEVYKSGADTTSGWSTLRSDSATFNLLNLRNGVSDILGTTKLDPAHYTQIRLVIGLGSNVVVNGVTYPLEVPSGAQSGLKLTKAFTIEAGKLYEMYLDFDAERSVKKSGNKYKLDPTIRIEARVTSGTIAGTVLPLDAKGYVWTLAGADTVSTYCNTSTGFFKLMALPGGVTYSLRIQKTAGTYRDTTLSVSLSSGEDKNLGTITLGQ
jgi:hypothetical protein